MVKRAGDGVPTGGPGSWTFGDGLAPSFDSHIEKSVPGYASAHHLITLASDFFLVEGSRCVDLGCSTGTLLRKLAQRHVDKNIDFFGCDVEEEMVVAARDQGRGLGIEVAVASALDVDLEANMVVSVFTLQFILQQDRQNLVDSIYANLRWGGGFFLFEKVRGSDARFQDVLTSVHLDWKIEQGFSEKEVLGKWQSLKGSMEPFSEKGNLDMLRRAGFQDIEVIWKWGPFQGFLAIK